jgi:polyphosphate glucokinase
MKPAAYASYVADAVLPGLGIDFGGTGIKAALVDLGTGQLLSRRHRVDTPKASTPDAVAAAIVHVVELCHQDEPVPDGLPAGLGIPGVIKSGVVMTAANIDKAWVGVSADDVVGAALGRPVYAINDADCAGMAEMRLGAARAAMGTVLMLTVGTGIGSGLFVDGRLVPNTELGHLEHRGRDAELRLSGVARERRRLRWKAWALEFNAFLAQVETLFWPDLIVLGGGVSKAMDRYDQWLKSRAPIVPAKYRNTSGILGAAQYAADRAAGAPPVD